MKIYIDTEFDGFGGDLISMALVAADGREWYGVLPNKGAGMYEPWVFGHVIPYLRREEATIDASSIEELRTSFRNFMSGFDNPTIVSDWYTDIAHFLSLFQGEDHTESFNYSCNMVLDMNLSADASKVPHNALYDARAIKNSSGAVN